MIKEEKSVPMNKIDAQLLAKMFLAGAKNLESKKEWINELNVFPVPDGDTGTNMTMTIMAAAKEVASMDDPDMALEAIQSGVCDVVSLGRPLLADPDYCNKLRAGQQAQIRPCISCHEGCMGRIAEYSMINCAVNPRAARERVTAYEPILQKKKVLIVGGGVAGCEAARVLAIRGHVPGLFEKNSYLGGAPDFKEDDIALATWYTNELKRLGVEVHMNTTITAKDILERLGLTKEALERRFGTLTRQEVDPS